MNTINIDKFPWLTQKIQNIQIISVVTDEKPSLKLALNEGWNRGHKES